jgi:hypothetical protein
VIQNYCIFSLVSIGNWSDLSLKEFEKEDLLTKVQKQGLKSYNAREV